MVGIELQAFTSTHIICFSPTLIFRLLAVRDYVEG